MSKREEDFHNKAEKYANECGGTTQEKCAIITDYYAGCEHGYQYARRNLWHDAQGDNVPEYGREVIVIRRSGMICYGHRPNPKEYVIVEGKKCFAKTYDKNDWNIPDIALWLDVEIPNELIEQITDKWFEENEQKRD